MSMKCAPFEKLAALISTIIRQEPNVVSDGEAPWHLDASAIDRILKAVEVPNDLDRQRLLSTSISRGRVGPAS
jgi:hypothetical protein